MKNNKNNEGVIRLTEDEILNDPSLAHFHEAVRFMQRTPSKDIFPKKYEAGVITAALDNLHELFEENPNKSLRKILKDVIGRLPNDITPLLLSKVIQNVLEEWENLLAESQKESLMLVTV